MVGLPLIGKEGSGTPVFKILVRAQVRVRVMSGSNYNISIFIVAINRLFANCKGGNFNIHIWTWFGYFIG